MGDAEKAGERAAVVGNPEFQCGKDRRLYGGPLRILPPLLFDESEKGLRIVVMTAHAASRLRKETMIDFEVGVSLSSPALPSGTSTFSSG